MLGISQKFRKNPQNIKKIPNIPEMAENTEIG
jgi:hypothetical protein